MTKVVRTRPSKTRPFSVALQDLVSREKFWSVRTLTRHINGTGISTSSSTVWREPRRQGLRKCKTYPCGNGKQTALEIKRKEFSLMMQGVNMKDVICVDETSFYQQPNPRYAWTKGLRIRVPMMRTTGKRHSLLIGVSHSGVAHHQIVSGSFNSALFATFITDLRSKTTCRYILLDNVAFHKVLKSGTRCAL